MSLGRGCDFVTGPDDERCEGGRKPSIQAPGVFDEVVFESFHAETFAPLWTFARRICRDESEAQDVCQQAYVAVYRYWKAGRLREDPRRLLYRVAQRGAIDVVRARSRRQRLERAVAPPAVGGPWLGIEVREALRAMKPEDAALLLLQSAVGLSQEEMAGEI